MLALLVLAVYFILQRKQRAWHRQHVRGSEHSEHTCVCDPLTQNSSPDMVVMNQHAVDAVVPAADLVCKSVFANSNVPDNQDWAVPSLWGLGGNGVSSDKADSLATGISAPAPASQSHKGWALRQLWSAEPPPEVNSPSLLPPSPKQSPLSCN